MLYSQPFAVIYILLGAISSIRASSLPYVEHDTPFSITPYFLYASPKPSAVFSGYMYTTQDFNGAASNVIFTTGSDSIQNLKMQTHSILKTTEMEKKVQNNMQEMSRTTGMPAEMSLSLNMDSEIENTMKSSTQAYNEYSNEINGMEQNHKVMKKDRKMTEPLPVLENSIFSKDSSDLRLQRTYPQLYIVPNVLQTPQYSHSSFGSLQVPTYTINNPFVRFFYQSPFVSTTNTFQHTLNNQKDTQDSTKKINEQRTQINCTTSNFNNINSKSIKITPASEYVTNAIEKLPSIVSDSSTEITTNTMQEVTSTANEVNTNKSNDINESMNNATESTEVTTNANPTTNLTKM